MTATKEEPSVKYKLTDFSICGQAEPIRMIFHTAGLEYEEQLVELENWCVIHPTVPTDRMPVLSVTKPDGQVVVYKERMAISRWLASNHKLMGANIDEYYLVEQMLSLCLELEVKIKMILGANNEHQRDLVTFFLEKDAPKLLDLICKALTASTGPFVTGKQVSFGDLFLLHILDQLHCLDPSILRSDYPMLLTHRHDVYDACPCLAKYQENRPHISI